MYDIIIIGAGASGMMAAVTAARRGAKVALLEHKDAIGKKILATGNGRCNYTNKNMSADKYHGSRQLIKNGLSRFNENDTIAFFESLGIPAYDNNGYIYPNSKQAASVVAAFRMELCRTKVDVKTDVQIDSIHYKHDKDDTSFIYQVNGSFGRLTAPKLIIACGLTASSKLGSDGSLFNAIGSLGHHMSDIVPALCGFYCSGLNFKKITGVRCDATVSSIIDGTLTEEETGELQLTDYGLSGIPVFQISSLLSRALKKGQKAGIAIDFMPSCTQEKLSDYLKSRRDATTDRRSLNEMLNGLLNSKLLLELIHKSGLSPDQKGSLLTDKEITMLTDTIKHTTVSVSRARDAEFAQVCAGGLRTKEIDARTLESKVHPGLYFAGELLDVDGICGGYNLQWAWTSGYITGMESSK